MSDRPAVAEPPRKMAWPKKEPVDSSGEKNMWGYMLQPMRVFIEWWAGLNWVFRIAIPVVLLGISLIFLLFGRFFILRLGSGNGAACVLRQVRR